VKSHDKRRMVRNYEVSGGEPMSNKERCKKIMDYIMEEVYKVQNTSEGITDVEDIINKCQIEEYKIHLRYFWNRLCKNRMIISENV
jgi:hypothetical protein